MSLNPVIRIFFALQLPEHVKEKLVKFISTFKQKSKSNVLRLTEPEHFHITLQFLQGVDPAHLNILIQQTKVLLTDFQPSMIVKLGGCILFPSARDPRLLALDAGPLEALTQLSTRIGQAIQQVGYAIETRPYRPHLTLMRFHHDHFHDRSIIQIPENPVTECFTVSEVTLFQSHSETGRSVYTVLARIPL